MKHKKPSSLRPKAIVGLAVLGCALVAIGYHFGHSRQISPQKGGHTVPFVADELEPERIRQHELFSLVNVERQKVGAKALAINDKLNASASSKCADMAAQTYWSHNRPDGTEPWYFFRQAGFNYIAAGENLAYGFSDARAVVDGWIASPSHLENMLKAKYTQVGYSVCLSEKYVDDKPELIVVQHLGR